MWKGSLVESVAVIGGESLGAWSRVVAGGTEDPGGCLERCVAGRILGGRFHVRGEGGVCDEMLRLLDLRMNPAAAGRGGVVGAK